MSRQVKEAEKGTEETDSVQVTDLYEKLVQNIEEAVKAAEGKAPSSVDEVSVHDFMKKVQYRVARIHDGTKRKRQPKRLVAAKTSYFKNRTRHDAKFCFRECVMDTTSCSVSKTRGFTVGVVGGLSPSSPIGGGIAAGAGASYSRSKSTELSETRASSKELLAEIVLEKDECARAVTELYCTEYEATCDLDITANTQRVNKHIFFYTPLDKKDRISKVTAKEVLNVSGGGKDFTFRRSCHCVLEDFEYELRIEMDTDAKEVQWPSPYSPILGWACGVP